MFAGFSKFLSQLLVPSLRYRRFPLGIFFGILVLSSGRLLKNMMARKYYLCTINRGACLRWMATLVFFPSPFKGGRDQPADTMCRE